MITISTILMIVLAVIVLVILFQILNLIAAKLGLDAVWVRIGYLILLLVAVIWAFGLFGVTQPLIK